MKTQEQLLLELAHELGMDKKYTNLNNAQVRQALIEYDASIRNVLTILHINTKGKKSLDKTVEMKDQIFFIKNGLSNSRAVYDYENEKIYGSNHDGQIYLSLLHEDIHYLGRHGKYTGIYNIETKENEAFNECLTEYLTSLFWLLMTEEEIGYTCYDAQIEVLEPFFEKLGLKKLLDIYFYNKEYLIKKYFEMETNSSWEEFNKKLDATLRNPCGIEQTIYSELDELRSIIRGVAVCLN